MLRKFVDSPLWDAADVEVWFGALTEIGRRHGFDCAIFALSARDNLPFSDAFYKCNHSMVWRRIYEQKRYVHIDPIVRYCRSQVSPLIWGKEDFASPEEQLLYEQACGFGLRWGVALPIHGPKHEVGMLCFASSSKSDEERRNVVSILPELGLLRDIVYETGLQHARQNASAVIPKLTPREIECLRWMTLGKSTWEISMILRCSPSTANYHIMNIRNKMGVHSRNLAVVKAIVLGLVEAEAPVPSLGKGKRYLSEVRERRGCGDIEFTG
jgi:LuxR family transcriptional regulator, quorum-sensing system regulator LasR